MIQEMILRVGRLGSQRTLKVPCRGITVLVGPNNSGKSLLLRELEGLFWSGYHTDNCKIVADYSLSWPSVQEINDLIKPHESSPHENPQVSPGQKLLNFVVPNHGNLNVLVDENAINRITEEQKNRDWMAQTLLKHFLIRLDGKTRFSLTDDIGITDLQKPPTTIIGKIFSEKSIRLRIRQLVYDGIQRYFVIDPTGIPSYRIRLSAREPRDDSEEQALDGRAREFHASADHIKTLSDGIQAYVGILMAVCSGNFGTILIDEPEAFLHPPLVRKLGQQLAELTQDRNANLFAATHSSDFLLGCANSGLPITLVRLSYRNNEATGRVFEPLVLKSLLQEPIMRSANIVSALFHEGVVVTEADGDRLFYGDIYQRIQRQEVGLPATLFVNARGISSIKNLVRPIRLLGIPAAAFVDLDVVKLEGRAWADLLEAVLIPELTRGGLGQQRGEIRKKFDELALDMKKGGILQLPPGDRDAVQSFLDTLAQYGLFVVPVGEMECWLKNLSAAGSKDDWVMNVLGLLGSDFGDSGYVHPGEDDVWEFVRKVCAWIGDPQRRGMPQD